MKEIGYPVHPKCVFWTHNSDILAKALLSHVQYTGVGPLLTRVCHIRNTALNFLSHLKLISYIMKKKNQCHIEFAQKELPVSPSEVHIKTQCLLSIFFHEKCWWIELQKPWIQKQQNLANFWLQDFHNWHCCSGHRKTCPLIIKHVPVKKFEHNIVKICFIHLSFLCYTKLGLLLNCKWMRHIQNRQIPLTNNSHIRNKLPLKILKKN